MRVLKVARTQMFLPWLLNSVNGSIHCITEAVFLSPLSNVGKSFMKVAFTTDQTGDFPVRPVRLHLSMQAVQVQSLVRELKCYMTRGKKKTSNDVRNSLKTF